MAHVVSFDAGMTLVELDLDFLSRRLAERALEVPATALRAVAPAAWLRYDERVDAGGHHTTAWHDLLADLVHHAAPSVGSRAVTEAVAWLWSQQPTQNLFRAPIVDMVALARQLAARGVRTAVLSNSEGRLAELLAAIGIADAFEVVVDSGRVGIEKPDPRIFELVLAELGVTASDVAVHVGDSWSADITGALAAGWRAVWYGRRAAPVSDPRVACARSATETAAALGRFGI